MGQKSNRDHKKKKEWTISLFGVVNYISCILPQFPFESVEKTADLKQD